MEAPRGSKPVGQEQWDEDQAREDPCQVGMWVFHSNHIQGGFSPTTTP